MTLSQGFPEGCGRVSQVKRKERKDLPGQKRSRYELASLRKTRRAGVAGAEGKGWWREVGEGRWPLWS